MTLHPSPVKIASRVDHPPKVVVPQKQTPGGAGTPDRAEIAIESEASNVYFTAIATAAKEFLSDVLPEEPGRHYVLWTKHDKRHHSFGTVDDVLVALFGPFFNVADTYFATAAFGDEISPKTGGIARAQTNVVGKLALYADMDCGAEKFAKKPDETYPTRDDALRAAVHAIQGRKLPMPSYIISSGTGIHLYWCLESAVDRHKWNALAHGLAQAGEAVGLKFDPACTEDSARLLRPIGALHSCGNRVTILKKTGRKYTPDQLATLFGIGGDPFHSPTAKRALTGVNADVLGYDGSPTEFELIAQGCGAVSWAAAEENQPRVNRDYWRGLLGIVKHCAGADELAHVVSMHHSEYDEDTTERTLAGWEAGPTTCEYFSRFDGVNGGACTNCPHVNGAVQ